MVSNPLARVASAKVAPELMTDDINPPTLDPQAEQAIQKSKEEKRFLLKLDIFLLTFGCIS